MFGKGWESAKGTVVAKHAVYTSGDGMVSNYEFVVDVRTTQGEVFRTKVGEPRIATNFKDPSVGDVVRVEVQTKTRTVRFDKDDPALSWKAYKQSRNADFDETLTQAPGTAQAPPSTGGPDLAQIQALLQGAGAQGGVIRLDAGNPEAAALRETLLRLAGQAEQTGTAAPTDPAE